MEDIGPADQGLKFERGTNSFVTFGPNQTNDNTKLSVGSCGGGGEDLDVKYQGINDGGSALPFVSNGNFLIDCCLGHNLYLNYFSGGNVLGSGGTYYHSDDRLKSEELLIDNAVETLSKLKPQTHRKSRTFDSENPTDGRFEAGLIAQEIYYDCPELRHTVFVPPGATPSETKVISDDPTVDPDYSDWGDEASAVNDIEIIPYLSKAVQELKAEIEYLKGEIEVLKAE